MDKETLEKIKGWLDKHVYYSDEGRAVVSGDTLEKYLSTLIKE